MTQTESETEESGIQKMSDGGLRILANHLLEARNRLSKADKRMAMHDVEEGISSEDVEWIIGSAKGDVTMSLNHIRKEQKRREDEQ